MHDDSIIFFQIRQIIGKQGRQTVKIVSENLKNSQEMNSTTDSNKSITSEIPSHKLLEPPPKGKTIPRSPLKPKENVTKNDELCFKSPDPIPKGKSIPRTPLKNTDPPTR